ncbi:hypothetical protein CGCA056_v003596 [Colletotrichum aenigma]|uniref:uncharacterized protein n=1 Tax=Colletotrichum aenigma TaxID=1215731 RepID=UPI0018728B5B|nr:uncharacterized protein CGCA056_v003596 [Colletotrichum aenigma]KAF5526196.1 hypothetical protein CGCA056_v003596 [Colletotrichum aenigma]
MSKGDYVQFELVPMGDESNNPQHFKYGEYPPYVEVEGKRYLYNPVPMDVAIDGIDLPHLTRPDRRHRTKYWVTRFPKKLQGRLERHEDDNGIVVGWGIRIHECLNWYLVFSLLLVSLVIIWVNVAIYLAFKADDSSGFGLGALLAAFAAVYVPLQYQAWKEKVD